MTKILYSEKKENLYIPLALFFITIMTRIPFTSKYLYHSDSVHFALALEEYNIKTHQPHPPGYFLYVMLGRLLNLFISDANTLFIIISIFFSGLTIVAIYFLTKEMFDTKTALIASAISITSPNIWFHGEVALTYIIEAFFSTTIAFFCWKIYKGYKNPPTSPFSKGGLNRPPLLARISKIFPTLAKGGKGGFVRVFSEQDKYLYLSAILLAIAGGIRQNTTVFLLPLWLFSIKRMPLKKIILSFVILGSVCLLWFIPMIQMTGGYNAYKEAFRELWLFNTGTVSVFHAGWVAFKFFSTNLYNFIVYSLGVGVVCILFAFYLLLKHKKIYILNKSKSLFFLFWIMPSFMFHLLIFMHPANPGYILIFTSALFIIASLSIKQIAEELNKLLNRDYLLKITSFVVLTNIIFFISFNHPVSYKAIKTHDKDLNILLKEIKKYNPLKTAIFVGPYTFYDYRHIMYYLPEYRVYQVDVRVAPTGEIRKTFWGMNKKTFLTEKIIIPPEIETFASILISDDVDKAKDIVGVSLRKINSTEIYIASGDIQLIENIYPELRIKSQ